MPHFRDTLATLTANAKSVTPLVNLTEPGTGPPLMDSQNQAVKIMIKGRDLHGCIIDGGSGVNVITEATCHNLLTLGGHMFTISAVVLRLEAPGTYPMLLGLPWPAQQILSNIGSEI